MQSCASGSYACMYHYCNKYNIYKNITLKYKCGQLIGNFNPDTKIGSIVGSGASLALTSIKVPVLGSYN